jgi:hypothetical protein
MNNGVTGIESPGQQSAKLAIVGRKIFGLRSGVRQVSTPPGIIQPALERDQIQPRWRQGGNQRRIARHKPRQVSRL